MGDGRNNIVFETELYHPVKSLLEKNGYTVRGEVKNLDVAAVKGDQLIAVEMKKAFNLELIFQCVDRQRTADSVYCAIPRPDYYGRTTKWRKLLHLARRLEIGIIIVCSAEYAEIAIHPKPFDRVKSRQLNAKKRISIIGEISARSFDGNTGGSTRKKLMTAYREKCIAVAKTLRRLKTADSAALIANGTDPKKTAAILRNNFYGWFERTDDGKFKLTATGRKEIRTYNQ